MVKCLFFLCMVPDALNGKGSSFVAWHLVLWLLKGLFCLCIASSTVVGKGYAVC